MIIACGTGSPLFGIINEGGLNTVRFHGSWIWSAIIILGNIVGHCERRESEYKRFIVETKVGGCERNLRGVNRLPHRK